MNEDRGAIWRQWDLHIHTPDSLVQHYGVRSEKTWEKFLQALEALPPQISVLGINDYIFLDGYRHLLAEKQKGRLSNISLMLPVIELRLDKFGGTDSALSRVNFHVIFSDELDPDTIEHQFINALPRSYKLSPPYAALQKEWSGVPNRSSLEDLGKKIIASVPERERSRFDSPLLEGFNNLNLSLDDVLNVLESTYFRGKHITAVGKTEWWNIKWNDKSIADKKNIINSAQLVFIACANQSDYARAKDSLVAANVNARLVDCSDAHWFADSPQKERLGNCLTWMKADPSFEGLRQVIIEPDERIFVGAKPYQLKTVADHSTRFIKKVDFKKVTSGTKTLNEVWFNSPILLNNGLVAIIGNKGSGKSALADVIGLLGNSHNQFSFSFLNKDKFLKPPELKARYFEATITWESGEHHTETLDRQIAVEDTERVKYIPQDYFEAICTQLPDVEENTFDKELKSVIFSHVKEEDKLGMTSLGDLINYRSSELDEALHQGRRKVEAINSQICDIEDKLVPEYKAGLQNELRDKKAELAAHNKRKPSIVRKPSAQAASRTLALSRIEKNRVGLEIEISEARDRRKLIASLLTKIEKVKGKLANFQSARDSLWEELASALEGLELTPDQLVDIRVSTEPLDKVALKLTREKSLVDKKLDADNVKSLIAKLNNAKRTADTLREQMDKPARAYQDYKDRLADWQAGKREIVGKSTEAGSIDNLTSRIRDLKQLPGQLEALYEQRRKYAKAVHKCLRDRKSLLTELYSPVQSFVSDHPDIRNKIQLEFGVSIANVGFTEAFLEWINLGKGGAFSGAAEAKKLTSDLASNCDFEDPDAAAAFADSIVTKLQGGQSPSSNSFPNIDSQLRKGKNRISLYNYLFSFPYLDARYVLRLGNKDLRQLSPGERGALLVVFYLLVDMDTKPLIIDQPEHNLDNETVTKVLVPAIKEAKQRRQIIIVTHNPILAVVCNAEQFIVASLDIATDHTLRYITGAIENPRINNKIVDILEGTMLAFDNRNRKYIREVLAEHLLGGLN